MLNTLRELLLFLNIIRFSNKKVNDMIETGDIEYLVDISQRRINSSKFLTKKEKLKLLDAISLYDSEREIDRLHKNNIKFTTILDSSYPKRLKMIYNPPTILYYKGEDIELINNALAIVGTRKPTQYGIWVTKNILSGFRNYDVQVVSGMATGIDFYAHSEAIKNGILTVGVLASSLDIEYPKSNQTLYQKMKNNILISEFPLGSNPIKSNFVLRNRIISGLSFATLVIEAAEKSGSLITANYAIEQDREVYAIPGNLNNEYSKGCNKLIKSGAKLIENANDIIQDLDFIQEVEHSSIKRDVSGLSEIEKKVLMFLKDKIASIDEISDSLNLEVNTLYTVLTKLEINDIIFSDGNIFGIK